MKGRAFENEKSLNSTKKKEKKNVIWAELIAPFSLFLARSSLGGSFTNYTVSLGVACLLRSLKLSCTTPVGIQITSQVNDALEFCR